MKPSVKTFLLRDLPQPLSTLSGAGLVIMASSRLAFGLVAAFALLWVYNLTMTAVFFAQPVYPKQGGGVIRILLASLLGSVLLLLLWFFSPLLALETSCLMLLVSCYCAGSPLFKRIPFWEIRRILFQASTEAGSLGALIIAFALIREPLGFMTLSLPGGPQGIIEIFQTPGETPFLPIRLIAGSAGALMLLGYGAALFRSIKKPEP